MSKLITEVIPGMHILTRDRVWRTVKDIHLYLPVGRDILTTGDGGMMECIIEFEGGYRARWYTVLVPVPEAE